MAHCHQKRPARPGGGPVLTLVIRQQQHSEKFASGLLYRKAFDMGGLETRDGIIELNVFLHPTSFAVKQARPRGSKIEQQCKLSA